MTKTFKLILGFLLMFAYGTRASEVHYNFKQVSVGDGLSHSTVTSILKTSKGNLWVGTRSGLNIIDQDEIRIYLHEEENNLSLPSNDIYFVMEDSQNNIWVSTANGLARYDASSDRFILVIRDRIYHFLTLPDGILFAGDNYLFHYEESVQSYRALPINSAIEEPAFDQYKVFKLQWMHDGSVLLTTKNNGLLRYNLQSNKIEPLTVAAEHTIMSSHTDGEGNIYYSFYNEGLFCYDRDGNQTAHYTTRNSALTNNIILDIHEREGELWLATDGGGITILNKRDQSMRTLQHIPGDPASLPVNSIMLLYHDQDNDLWAGTVRGGLFQIKETYIRINSDVALNNHNGLSERAIISLLEDADSTLWIGTDGGGINKYNPFTGRFTHFLNTYGDKVVSITDLSESELIVSLYGKGVYVFNKHTGRYRPFTIVNDSVHQSESFGGYMPLLHRIGRDQILVLSQNAYVYHPSNQSFIPVTTASDRYELAALNLQYAGDEYIFLSKENSVYFLSRETYVLDHLLTINENDVIHSVSYDGKGTLWLGTNNGLKYYNLKEKKLSQIETKMFNEISYLYYDDKDRLWISAQNRLFSYIIPQDRFVIWSESEGFTANEILYMYQQKSRTNNIYLGGTNGLVIIDEEIAYDTQRDDAVNLVDFHFNGKSHLQALDEETRIVRIPSTYTSLLVHMGLKGTDIFSQTLFRYHISGLSDQYTETYSRRINLPQLPPGNYTIDASFLTSSGEWSQPSTILKIHVRPPWYKSSWFLLLMILLALLLIYGIMAEVIRRNRYRLVLEKKEMEQRVNEEKIGFLVNVSHELRTPLTLVYAPLKRLLENNTVLSGNGYLKEQLVLIFKQTVLMKDVINMVLDINKLNTGYDTLVKQPHPLNSWIEALANDFRNEMENKQLSLVLTLDPTLDRISFDDSKCRIILSNLLMNALKFSESSTTITVGTKKENGSAFVTVSDEGVGLKDVDTTRLFSRFYQGKHGIQGSGIGLYYSRTLIEKHGGTIGAYDNEDKGATFFFSLPVDNGAMIPTVPSTEVDHGRSIKVALEATVETAAHVPARNINLRDYSLLLVEDNSDLLGYLQESFADVFKILAVATDGEAALDQIQQKQPDIVVSDVMMPGMDGYQLCRHIKTDINISHIPVILLTAKSDKESIESGYKQGADFYITKPFDIDFLRLIITNQLAAREAIKAKHKQIPGLMVPEEVTISSADEIFLNKLNQLIADNLSNPALNVDFLTTEIAMSRSSLYNKMSNLLGIGVNDYINKMRLSKAAELLEKTEMAIGDIAADLGFKNQRYFSTLFKQGMGVSPSEHRKKNHA